MFHKNMTDIKRESGKEGGGGGVPYLLLQIVSLVHLQSKVTVKHPTPAKTHHTLINKLFMRHGFQRIFCILIHYIHNAIETTKMTLSHKSNFLFPHPLLPQHCRNNEDDSQS